MSDSISSSTAVHEKLIAFVRLSRTNQWQDAEDYLGKHLSPHVGEFHIAIEVADSLLRCRFNIRLRQFSEEVLETKLGPEETVAFRLMILISRCLVPDISHRGDADAKGNAVKEAINIWDETPDSRKLENLDNLSDVQIRVLTLFLYLIVAADKAGKKLLDHITQQSMSKVANNATLEGVAERLEALNLGESPEKPESSNVSKHSGTSTPFYTLGTLRTPAAVETPALPLKPARWTAFKWFYNYLIKTKRFWEAQCVFGQLAKVLPVNDCKSLFSDYLENIEVADINDDDGHMIKIALSAMVQRYIYITWGDSYSHKADKDTDKLEWNDAVPWLLFATTFLNSKRTPSPRTTYFLSRGWLVDAVRPIKIPCFRKTDDGVYYVVNRGKTGYLLMDLKELCRQKSISLKSHFKGYTLTCHKMPSSKDSEKQESSGSHRYAGENYFKYQIRKRRSGTEGDIPDYFHQVHQTQHQRA